MARYALGVLTVLLVMALGGAAVLFAGAFDVRATTEDPPLLAWAIHRTMQGAVRDGSRDLPEPPAPSAAQVAAGFALYDSRCAMCHGGPGVPRADWVTGLNPSPPYLLDAAQHWDPKQLEWIVAKGVRMTAMPAWQRSMNHAQILQTVAFLRALPDIDAATYLRMREAARNKPNHS